MTGLLQARFKLRRLVYPHSFDFVGADSVSWYDGADFRPAYFSVLLSTLQGDTKVIKLTFTDTFSFRLLYLSVGNGLGDGHGDELAGHPGDVDALAALVALGLVHDLAVRHPLLHVVTLVGRLAHCEKGQ